MTTPGEPVDRPTAEEVAYLRQQYEAYRTGRWILLWVYRGAVGIGMLAGAVITVWTLLRMTAPLHQP
jgi:hypothetical protein